MKKIKYLFLSLIYLAIHNPKTTATVLSPFVYSEIAKAQTSVKVQACPICLYHTIGMRTGDTIKTFSDSLAHRWEKYYIDDMYFPRMGGRNNGTPSSVMWMDANGRMMASPMSEMTNYLKTLFPAWADTVPNKIMTKFDAQQSVAQVVSDMAATYYPLTNPNGYISSYTVDSSRFETIYYGTTHYYPLTGNPSGFLTSIAAQSFASLTGKPTTLSGYGITDAYPLSGNPSGFISSVPAQTFASLTGKPTTLAGYGISDGITSATAASTYATIANLALKNNIADTASMLSPYARTNALTSLFALKFNLSDTATAFAGYQRKLTAGTGISITSNVISATGGTGTVTSIGLSSTDFAVSGSPVTTSGSITANLNTSGVSAGTYEYITVNTKGIVTAGYNSVTNTLATRSFGTAYQASNTGRIYDIDCTVSIAIGAGLISTSDGQISLEISANGTTGWTEYSRSQNKNQGVLAAQNTQVGYIEAKNIPAGYYYRLNGVVNAGTVTFGYVTGHEVLKR